MSWFGKKKQDAALLCWARRHPAWNALRADLEVPRVPTEASLRSAGADFLSGLEKEVLEAERDLEMAGDAVRQAVIGFAAFDAAHRTNLAERDRDQPPPLVRATRRLATHFNDG